MVHLKGKIQFHVILVTDKIIISEQGEKSQALCERKISG